MAPTVKLSEDQTGYLLDGRRIDGFGDQPDLPDPVRYRIAQWASALTPESLGPAQRDLIERVSRRNRPAGARRARKRSDMLRSPIVRALWDTLEEGQQRAVLEVDTVLGARAKYPLSSGELARLTGIERHTIRRWRLPHTRNERNHREYGAAAVVMAFAYKGTKQNSREYFKDLMVSATPLHELRRSIALATHSVFAGEAPPQVDESVARELEELSREMTVLGEAFGRAAIMARTASPEAPHVDTTAVRRLPSGMDLRDLGEEIELLDREGRSAAETTT